MENTFKGFSFIRLYLARVTNLIFITKLLIKDVQTLPLIFKTGYSYETFKEFFFSVSNTLEQGRVISLTHHMLFNWPCSIFWRWFLNITTWGISVI